MNKNIESPMLRYMYEVSSLMKENIENSYVLTKELVEIYERKEYKKIRLIACGSSYHSASAAKIFMEKYLLHEVETITPFTFNHYNTFYKEDYLNIVISQTGNSSNIIDCCQKLLDNNQTIIGLSASKEGKLTQYCNTLITWGITEEKTNYVTKGPINLMLFLMLFAIDTALKKGHLEISEYRDIKKEMVLSAENYDELLTETERKFYMNFGYFTSLNNINYVAAGPNYYSALESVFKITEASGVVGTVNETEELLHGNILQIDYNYSVIFIDNMNHSSSKKMHEVYKKVSKLTNRIWFITNDKEIEDVHAFRIKHDTDSLLAPLYTLAVGHMLCYLIASYTRKWYYHPLYYKMKEEFNK